MLYIFFLHTLVIHIYNISVYMYIFVSISHEPFTWYWVKINEMHGCYQEKKKTLKVLVTCSSRDWYDTGTCITCCVRRVCYKVYSPVICHIFKIYVTGVFSSPELRAVSYSDRPLSVVRPSVRLSVNFYIFDFFSRTTGPILTRLRTNHPWGRGF
jgi:hypothetical protein